MEDSNTVPASTALRSVEERPNDDGPPGFDDAIEDLRRGQDSAHLFSSTSFVPMDEARIDGSKTIQTQSTTMILQNQSSPFDHNRRMPSASPCPPLLHLLCFARSTCVCIQHICQIVYRTIECSTHCLKPIGRGYATDLVRRRHRGRSSQHIGLGDAHQVHYYRPDGNSH